jgi:DNA-binding CsgD family transcriptional regulator
MGPVGRAARTPSKAAPGLEARARPTETFGAKTVSKSSRLDVRLVLPVTRLLADVAAMRHDPQAQRQHLVDGFNAVMHVRAGWFFAIDDFLPGRAPVLRHQILCSDPDPDFARSIDGLGAQIPMEAEPFADHALHDPAAYQVWTRHRVLGRPDARRRYAPSLALYDESKVTDGMVGLYRGEGRHGRVVGLAVHRMRAEPRFRSRDQALLSFAVREVQDLVRRGHLPLAEPAPAGLSPRLQQVLERMLRGAAVKQTARELGLSVGTVRDHVQRLYRHYGVHGRDELMAKFVRR